MLCVNFVFFSRSSPIVCEINIWRKVKNSNNVTKKLKLLLNFFSYLSKNFRLRNMKELKIVFNKLKILNLKKYMVEVKNCRLDCHQSQNLEFQGACAENRKKKVQIQTIDRLNKYLSNRKHLSNRNHLK